MGIVFLGIVFLGIVFEVFVFEDFCPDWSVMRIAVPEIQATAAPGVVVSRVSKSANRSVFDSVAYYAFKI